MEPCIVSHFTKAESFRVQESGPARLKLHVLVGQAWQILLMDEILHHLGALNYCNS